MKELIMIPKEKNLVFKAADSLLNIYSAKNNGQLPSAVDIVLRKKIPIGSGLGGGSSNATTTLLALTKIWEMELSMKELMVIGAKLGADVPVFIMGQTAFAEGIGDILTPVDNLLSEKFVMLVKPDVSVSSAEIYKHTNLPRNCPQRSLDEFLSSKFENVMEMVVCQISPKVKDELEALRLININARMTGSGSCLFVEFNSLIEAETANKMFSSRKRHKETISLITRTMNSSPLHRFIKEWTVADNVRF